MLLDRLDRHLPPENRVALGAPAAELGAVNVGVTISAVLANVGENRFCMASRAGYFFVHALKRVSRGVVIEFGNGANRSPACVGVAIFAGNAKGTVRTSAGLSLGDCRQHEGQRGDHERQPTGDLDPSGNDCPLTPSLAPTLVQKRRNENSKLQVSAVQLGSGPEVGPVPLCYAPS